MARIPTYISDGGVNARLPEGAGRATATAEMLGAGIGAAQQQLGAAMIGAGVAVGQLATQMKQKQDALDIANGVGKFDFNKDMTELQTQAASNGKDFQVNVANKYDEKVDAYVNGLDVSENVRAQVKARLVSQRPSYMAQAAAFEARTLDAKDKFDSNDALGTQINSVRSNSTIEAYQQALEKGHAVIDAQPGATAVQKIGQKQAFAHMLGRARFEKMIQASQDDPVALQGVINELETDTWKSKLAPNDYDNLLDSANQKIKTANSSEKAAARAGIANLTERNDKGEIIDPNELGAVSAQVVAAGSLDLSSKMARINKQQSIYRDGKQMPLTQMRAEREKAMNAKGIAAMPEVIQSGVTSGVAITNGKISPEYLAGLVTFEYGQHLKSGDYGKGTGNTTSSGAIGSDAVGVAQFTGPTFLSTVRAHATELGVASGASDADILAKRKDPEFSIKAAALHAADNKAVLEARLGRSVTDADLYFAHFLGAGGAVRFLAAADANPKALATAAVDAGQVDANRKVFFNDNGTPRTNEQVKAFVAQGSMNNLTAVDYSGVVAWNKMIASTEKGLADSPMDFAKGVQRFSDIGDLSTPEGVQRRAVVAKQVAEYYGMPVRSFKPLTKDEIEQNIAIVKDGTADEALGVMNKVAGLGGDLARAALNQLGEKDGVFGHAAGLSVVEGQQGVAADIIRGEKQIKNNKDVLQTIGLQDSEIASSFAGIVGNSIIATEEGTKIRKAAVAHYVETHIVRGAARAGKFDTVAFEASVNAVLGGAGNPGGKALDKINGSTMLMPRGFDASRFETALNRMDVADYARLSKWGGPPIYNDGKPASPRDIANEGKFDAIGNGEYRIRMGDGSYLLSGAVTKNGKVEREVPYIFQGDPTALSEFANRATRDRRTDTLPPMAPNAVPAAPRVISNP